MPMTTLKAIRWLSIAAVICSSAVTAAEAAQQAGTYVYTPSELAKNHVAGNKWADLEALMLRLASSGERADDGRHHLFLATGAISSWFGAWSEDEDIVFDSWNKEFR